MIYDLTTDAEAVSALEYLYDTKDILDFITRRHIEELYRNLDMTRKFPKDEAAEFEILTSESEAVWHEAKEKNYFAMFEPYLEKVYSGVMKHTHYYNPEADPYDVYLDIFERGLNRVKCDSFFSELKSRISPLILKIGKQTQPDEAKIASLYSVEEQRKISDFCMKMMKVDQKYCTLGGDRASFYCGDELLDTCLATGCSMAIHESQSRFYENYIGRSREFTDLLYDYLEEKFPLRLSGIGKDDFYKIINKSTPSLIRTEADELTYSIHVMIRYELEKMIFDGKVIVHYLPREWSRLYGEYLGVEVSDHNHGILQEAIGQARESVTSRRIR